MKGSSSGTILLKSPMGRISTEKKAIVRYENTPGSGSDQNESEISSNNLRKSQVREGTASRRNIMITRAQTQAQHANLRSSIAGKGQTPQSGKSQGAVPVAGVYLEFNPKKYTTKYLKEHDVVQLKQVFDYYDTEDAGMLSPNDLKQLLQNNGFHATRETLYEIFAELDEEELGGIAFEYFLRVVDPKRHTYEKKDTIRRIYRKYDRANKGHMVMEDLKNVVYKDLQEDIDEDMLKEMFNRMDLDKDGKIVFEDFYNIMTKEAYF